MGFPLVWLLLCMACSPSGDRFKETNHTRSDRPNFVFILVDDYGWPFLSFPMDREAPGAVSDYFETPNIMRLAEEGIRFSNAYAPAAICSPTRRSIQFGQTPARQGDVQFAKKHEPVKHELFSIPSMLKSVDPAYQAAHYGKWDLRANIFPEDVGYDESDGNTGNGHGNMFRYKEQKWTEAFLTNDPKKIESLTGRAINFMERNVRDASPFYLQVSHYATHVDMQTKEETYNKYVDKAPGQAHKIPQFAGMVEDLDISVGQILDKIQDLGIGDNTYIFLLTDNGGVPFIPPNGDKLKHPSEYAKPNRNQPLRGGKWTLYEGGIRVPFLAMGPGIDRNTQCDQPIAGWDLLPTIADLAGFQDRMPQDVDGASFRTLLEKGNSGEMTRPGEGLVFHRFSPGYPHSAIRVGDYKLIKFWKDNTLELYDLSEDPGELHNLATALPEKTAELHAQLMQYMRKVECEILDSYN